MASFTIQVPNLQEVGPIVEVRLSVGSIIEDRYNLTESNSRQWRCFMNVPENLKYTEEHEWISVDGDIATIGITYYAQGELGDIVFVELPEVGFKAKQMEAFGTIEAVKAVSDMFAPVSGEVNAVNEKLTDEPEIINKDPYGEGWIIKIKLADPTELDSLLTAEDYKGKIS